ncbi:MAG: hypothetical protein IJW45_03665 [Oscillospiraceae bacterium]|nr:hypothetical protein [Oscillospiraceae bacterium]
MKPMKNEKRGGKDMRGSKRWCGSVLLPVSVVLLVIVMMLSACAGGDAAEVSTTEPTAVSTTVPETEATEPETEATEATTTEPETEATEAVTTEPETEATEAATTEPTEPTEAATTEPETEPTEVPITEPETEPTEGSGQHYVLNKNTKKFHYPTCSSAADIKEKNREDYYGDREDLIEEGFKPCKRCDP